MASVDWVALWRDVAGRVAAHRVAGRGHLVTEDTVRLETVLALGAVGVEPGRLRIEVLTPVLVKGKLDLVLDPPDGVVVELKYPRDSRTGFSPDTMTLGELLRDFLRVAAVSAGDRWVVQVVNDRLVKYLVAAFARYDLVWASVPGQTLELRPEAIAALPVRHGTRSALPPYPAWSGPASSRGSRVGDKLTLFAYRVASMTTETGTPAAAPTATATPVQPKVPPPAGEQVVAGTRDGARREILDAARAVVTRSGGAPFTMPEVIAEMSRRGTTYAERTIRTMISAHLCADATGTGVAGYADLTRAGRGLYRLTEPGPT